MQLEIATAVLDRTADLIIVFANTASQRILTPNEWVAYDSAMALFQQIATAFEITIDQQVIAPAIGRPAGPNDDGEIGTDNPERDS